MKTMNAQQENYMKAKAIVETLEAEADRIEKAYIAENSIINPNGEVPHKIYCIENEATFDQANEATAPLIDALGIHDARQLLRQAEDELIKYALSIIPAKERQILSDRCFGRNGHYVHIKVRKRVIELALKLDVSTVPSYVK